MESLEPGTYTIEARTYTEDYEGPFTLTVTVTGGTIGPAPSGCDPVEIAPDGSPVAGTWAADCESAAREGRYARYFQFTLTDSAHIALVLESDDAETVLFLRAGTDATSSDHIGFSEGESEYDYHRASIEENLAAGTYTVEATTYAAGETGDFTLTVSEMGGDSGGGGCEAADITTDGSAVPGSWGADCESQEREGSYARYYQFTLAEGDSVRVLLESPDPEPVLYLRQGAGNTSGDTVPNGFNDGDSEYDYLRASIEENLAAGTYTIEATTYNPGKTPDFTLTVSAFGGSPVPPQRFYGTAFIDDQPAGEGTLITAIITIDFGEEEAHEIIGEAVVDTGGDYLLTTSGLARYVGGVVRFMVGQHLAVETSIWQQGAIARLDLNASSDGAAGALGVPAAAALAPLGSNLLWMARYDNATNI